MFIVYLYHHVRSLLPPIQQTLPSILALPTPSLCFNSSSFSSFLPLSVRFFTDIAWVRSGDQNKIWRYLSPFLFLFPPLNSLPGESGSPNLLRTSVRFHFFFAFHEGGKYSSVSRNLIILIKQNVILHFVLQLKACLILKFICNSFLFYSERK